MEINNQYRTIANVIAAILFSFIFYQKSFGINTILFSILVIGLITFIRPQSLKPRLSIIFSALLLIASGIVFWHNSVLSLFSYFTTLFLFLGYIAHANSSVYVSFHNGFLSAIFSQIYVWSIRGSQEVKAAKKGNINFVFWTKVIFIPTISIIVFTSLYRKANPYFDNMINRIDLSFIDLGWILFTLLGVIIFNNISRPIAFEPITSYDINTENNLIQNKTKEPEPNKLTNETTLGIVLMVALNILIGLFLITDIMYILQENLTHGNQFSQAVHNGINALVTSIILTIAIILYFFRGDLNFFKKSERLKSIAYLWIFLNIILIGITCFKNTLYISNFGLTYKRIGVFVYLFLTLIGLLTTFIKVFQTKNLWYLFRRNTAFAFVILFICSFINWDAEITRYNLKHDLKYQSIDYLIDLSDRNAMLLKTYADEHLEQLSYDQKQAIRQKYLNHRDNLNDNSWQEYIYENIEQ